MLLNMLRWSVTISGSMLALAVVAMLAIPRDAAASSASGPLGEFEAHADVGSPKIAGYATYNAASQVYTLSAGGVNIWAERDEFQFAWMQDEGRLHRAGAGGVHGQGRGSAPQGRHHGAQPRSPISIRPMSTAPCTATDSSRCSTARRRAKTPRRPRCRPRKPRTSSSSNAAATCSSSPPQDSASRSRSRRSRTCRTCPQKHTSACFSPRTTRM